MKHLNNFITEKLKINKNSKLKSIKILNKNMSIIIILKQ